MRPQNASTEEREIARIGLALAALRAQWKRLGGPPIELAAAARASAPVVSAARLAALEAQTGAQLPADYRAFVTRVSGGGIGPGVGLYAVDDPAQWRALGARRTVAPERSANRWDLTQTPWGELIWLRLQGNYRGTLWIDGEDGSRPLSVAGEPMKVARSLTTFAPWFLQWLGAQREADAAILERRAMVDALRELSEVALAPKTIEPLWAAHEFKKLRADEVWETLLARGLVEESDGARLFSGPCPERTRRRAHPAPCARCNSTGLVHEETPSTVPLALAIAASWRAVLAAERVARELVARLSVWRPLAPRTVRWALFDRAALIARRSGDASEAHAAMRLAFERIAGTGARTQRYLREGDEVIARVLGSDAPPEQLLAADVASRHLTIERLREGRPGVAFEELARYSPFEPALALWKSGAALSAISDEAIELMVRPAD